MSSAHYILVNRKVQKASLMEWAAFFECHELRSVAQTDVAGFQVSTVFLGLDHNFSGSGPPVLWETMAFGDDRGREFDCRRCAGSWEQAEEMHARVVREVEKAFGLEQ